MNSIRPIISAIFGILLLGLCIKLAQGIAGGKEKPAQVISKNVQLVYVDTVINGSISLNLDATGNLQAKRKIELYSEVQGIFKGSSQAFKAGQKYAAGSTLLSLDNTEYKASLIAARSNFYSLISSIIPDLLMDYPASSASWKTYLGSIDINSKLPELPNMDNEQLAYFVNNKGIVTSYYNIKNMEERLSKYQITAPFSGVLTESLVTEGALVRAGQKLGEFIDPSRYELALSINESFKDLLKIGNKVNLQNLDGSKKYVGTVTRINSIIDAGTQSIEAYIELSSPDLNEGTYLAARLVGKEAKDVYEISRKLLIDNQAIYAVKDGALYLQPVKVVHFTKETAIVSGIPNGTIVLNKSVPGAHNGMLVETLPN